MVRRTVAVALLLIALFATARARDEVKLSEAHEDEAQAAEARGRYEEALDAYEKALTESVKEAAAEATPEGKARTLARTEFYLEKVGALTEKTSRFKTTGKFLEGVDGEGVGPALGAWVKWYRARALVAGGLIAEARALMGDLGFLTDFWIAGSFDNERGGGFAQAYAPENGAIDLDAEYSGKEREVRWRHVAETPIFGYVDLDALLRPNDQSLAYALAYLNCPDAREAAVRVASDEAVKVWINGEQVWQHDAQRQCGFDQDVAPVRLEKGWNRLLVKVCDQKGEWGFRIRFTTPDGAPMTDLVLGNSREDASAAETALAGRTPAPQPDADFAVARDARDAIEGAIAAGSADAREIFRLGFLHRRRQYEDRYKEEGLKLLKKALELDPKNPFFAFEAARAAETPVEMAVEKEENERRRFLELAIELERDYAAAYYLLARYYTSSLPIILKAERNVARALAVNPEFLDARLLEIELLHRRGFEVEAEAKMMELLELGRFEAYTPFLVERARLADALNRTTDEQVALRKAIRIDFANGEARAKLLETLKQAGDPEGALSIFEEMLVLDPYDLGAYQGKALLEEALGRYADASRTTIAALSICPEDDDLLKQVGRLYHKLGDKEEALAYWSEALALNPKLAELRRYVEFVDPESRPFEEAFPAELSDLLAKAGEFENQDNDPWLNILNQQIDKVNPDGTSSSFTRLVVKVLNEQGVRQFDRYGVRTYGGQSVQWRVARVIRPDGTAEEGRIVSGTWADLPRLSPGDVVHLEYRVDQLQQSFFGDYFGQSFWFASYQPTLKTEYIVITPAGKKLYFHTRNVEVEPVVTAGAEGATKIFRFTVDEPGKIRYEPLMPSPREIFPQLSVSNYGNWDEFAKWYWNLIEDQFRLSDEMKAKVAELIKDKETRYEKIRAIYEFVITDIRYDASWEFGVHGYKPYDATAIYARKFGDCKDKAILTTTLLREIGVDSYPVLIFAAEQRWAEDLTLPMVNHFNHCISFVPDVDGEGRPLFLDGTAQYHSMEAMPGMDRGARVLVVHPDRAEMRTVPWNEPELNQAVQTITADIAPDGSAKIKARIHFGGDLGVAIRSAFSIEGQQQLRLNAFVGQLFGKATLESFEFSDLGDLSKTAETIDMTVSVPKFAEETERGLELKANLGAASQLSSIAAAAERHQDIILSIPMTAVIKGIYRVPEGFRVMTLPENRLIDEPWGRFELTYETKDGEVRFTRALTFKTERIPSAEYEKFREFAGIADVTANDRIVLTRVENGK